MIIPELTKRPNEKFAVGLEYISPDLTAGATITAVTCTLSPDDGTLMKSGVPVIDGSEVSQVIYDGTDGSEYNVIFKTTTSEGNIFEDTIFVKVRSI